jgi:hypothetical protein
MRVLDQIVRKVQDNGEMNVGLERAQHLGKAQEVPLNNGSCVTGTEQSGSESLTALWRV